MATLAQLRPGPYNRKFWRGLANLCSWIWLAGLLGAWPIRALTPELTPKQYVHTGWTSRDHPSIAAVEALTETTDGYLWLGTVRGLARFNGSSFSVWKNSAGGEFPRGKITALAAAADGGLWIATTGRISKLLGARLTEYTSRDGVPGGTITAILEDHSGMLWVGGGAGGTGGIATIRNGAVRAVDTSKWSHAPVTALFEDRQQRVWAGTAAGVCQLSPGPASCWLTKPAMEIEAIRDLSSGEVLALDGSSHNIRSFTNGTWKPSASRLRESQASMRSLLVDRDDNLWIGTIGQGLLRIRDGQICRFTKQDGLTSDLVLSLFEDQEGNLWVGTSNGLDRFRDPKVARISKLEGLTGNVCTAVCATREGSVWVGTSSGGIDRLRGRSISHYAATTGAPGATVLSLHEDESGRLWTGTTAGVGYRTATGFVQVDAPDGKPLNRVTAMADRRGTLWVADSRLGLFRIREGRAEPEREFKSLRRDVFELFADREDRVWVGYYGGGVSVAGHGSDRLFGAESGLAGGAVEAIYEDSAGAIWVGAAEGLSRFRHGRWTTWDSRHGLAQGVQEITETGGDYLWLLTAGGLLRLEGTALSNTPDSAPRALSFRVYGPSDGISFAESRRMVNPRMTRSADDRIWIGTDDGLSWVDPKRPRRDSAPPVKVDQVVVDGRAVNAEAGALAYRGKEIEIRFAALSLGIPEAAEVRYRLEGFEQDWHPTKGETRITYGHLPPGDYRFRAVSANSDGVWNASGATVDFRSLPKFYQTIPFQAACGCALSGLIYGLHRLRMRVLRARLRLVLRERTRIARELHDTVLQGFVGTLYQMKAASLELRKSPEAGSRRLSAAIEQASQSLKEARQSLACLRMPALEDQSLVEALRTAGKRIVDGTAILFDARVAGRSRPLPYETEAALYVVAREAINNAMTHAQPARIQLKVEYAASQIRLTIEDDGIGFDLQEALAKNNHWGLAGMQERVKAIHARMTVDSQPPRRGTRIEIVAQVGAKWTNRKNGEVSAGYGPQERGE